MKILIMLAVVALSACASAPPPSPISDCGITCHGGDVDYFKSRDMECHCQDREELN